MKSVAHVFVDDRELMYSSAFHMLKVLIVTMMGQHLARFLVSMVAIYGLEHLHKKLKIIAV